MNSNPILIVDLAQGYGGVETRVIEMARGFHGQQDYAVAVLEGAPVHQRLINEGLIAEALPYHKRDPRNLFALLKIIRRGGYKVVDAHNDQSWLWGLWAAKLADVPVKVASVQLPCRTTPGGFRGRVQEWILRLNIRWGCTFMTVNKLLIDYLKGIGAPASDISLIYNAIELEKYGPKNSGLDLKEITGWPEDVVIFSIIARLVPQKAHDILLRAVAEAVKHEPRIRCLIVGEGKLEAALKGQTKDLNIESFVHFLGFRDDIPDILNSSDVFCLPSRSEGLPLALLEATAQQMPVLISDVDGMGELFNHLETAYMVPADDVAALAEGLIWHVNSMPTAETIGQNAYEFVKKRLSPQVMIDQTLDFYNDSPVSLQAE